MQKFFWGLILTVISLKVMAGTCYISGSNISFGRYISTDPLSYTIGTIYVVCTDSATYDLCIIINTDIPSPSRVLNMVGGTQTLGYELYHDNAGSPGAIWENGVCLNVTESCPYSSPCMHKIYGSIRTGQIKSNGTYSASIALHLDSSAARMEAQAYINTGCSISTDVFSFGTYKSTSALYVDASNLHVNCGIGVSYTIGLNNGKNYSGGTRRLTNGDGINFLNYNFYQDSGHTTVWSSTSMPPPTTGTGVVQNHTIYGAIPAGQSVPLGSYTDSIRATVNY